MFIIEIYVGQQDFDEGEEDAEELHARLSSALCCVAETLMGQAGEVSEVAEECEALLLRAAEADASSPEPMQVGKHPCCCKCDSHKWAGRAHL